MSRFGCPWKLLPSKKSEICHQHLRLLTFSRARRKPITFGNAVNKSCRQIQPEALQSIRGLHVVPFYSISAKKARQNGDQRSIQKRPLYLNAIAGSPSLCHWYMTHQAGNGWSFTGFIYLDKLEEPFTVSSASSFHTSLRRGSWFCPASDTLPFHAAAVPQQISTAFMFAGSQWRNLRKIAPPSMHTGVTVVPYDFGRMARTISALRPKQDASVEHGYKMSASSNCLVCIDAFTVLLVAEVPRPISLYVIYDSYWIALSVWLRMYA